MVMALPPKQVIPRSDTPPGYFIGNPTGQTPKSAASLVAKPTNTTPVRQPAYLAACATLVLPAIATAANHPS